MKDSCVPFTQIHSLLIYCFICLIILSLSLYVCRVCILLCYFFHESFARKLSTSCLFIPKYFSVHLLMGKVFHSNTMLVPTPGNLMLIQYGIQGSSPGTSSRSYMTVGWLVPLVPFFWNSSLVFEVRHFLKYANQLFCRILLIFCLVKFSHNLTQIGHLGQECYINDLVF